MVNNYTYISKMKKKIPIWSNQTIEHKIALEFQGPGLGQAKQMCRGQTVYCV